MPFLTGWSRAEQMQLFALVMMGAGLLISLFILRRIANAENDAKRYDRALSGERKYID